MDLYGFIGLAVIAAGLVAMVGAIRADARAQRAHEHWMDSFHAWLNGGMQGPRP